MHTIYSGGGTGSKRRRLFEKGGKTGNNEIGKQNGYLFPKTGN